MIAATAFGDVVQQHREIERTPRLHLVHKFRSDRRDLGEFAPLQRVEHAHRLDGMLVHGENMVGIELHLADDARPIRQIAAEKSCLVEDAKPSGAIGMLSAGPMTIRLLAAQQIHEDLGRLQIAAQRNRPPLVLDERPYRERVKFQASITRDLQDTQHLDRLGIEVPPGDRQQLAFRQHEPGRQQRIVGFGLEGRRAKRGSQNSRLQNACEPGDFPGGQEVVAHEAFHAILAAMARVSHPRPDNRLQIERQPLLCAACHVVEVEPDGPKELPRPSAVTRFLLRQDAAEVGQLPHRLGIENVTCDPVQGLQIA